MLFRILLIVVSCLVVGLNVYIHRRVSWLFDLGPRSRKVLALLMAAGFSAMVLARILRRSGFSAELGSVAALEAFTWTVEIGVVIAAILLVPVDLARWVGGRLGRGRGGRLRPPRTPAEETGPAPLDHGDPTAASASAETPPTPEQLLGASTPTTHPALPRRAFLSQVGSAAALTLGGGSSLYGTVFGRHDYSVEEAVFALPGLDAAYHGYTIVQLSDIHFGTFVGERELAAAVDLVRAARPDLVVLTGDLVDHDLAYLPYPGQLVRRLEGVAADGVTAIAGNHDHYAGVEEVLATVEAGGGEVLRNGSRLVGTARAGFNLLGVDDVWARRRVRGGGPDLQKALAHSAPELPRVLLCHNPSFFAECASAVDLQLSGHTHGGQVQLGLNPAELVLPYGYVAGRYERSGAQLYVNRGFGTAGPPTRVLSPPEVTRVVLTGA